MAPRNQVFLQVALLFCVVTTSMGGITDWQKAFSQLENMVNVQQKEIMSLHQMIEQLEKRLEPLEAKGEFGKAQTQPAVPTLVVTYLIFVVIIWHHLNSRVQGWYNVILHTEHVYVVKLQIIYSDH